MHTYADSQMTIATRLCLENHSGLLGGVPYIQAGKEAIVHGFDAGFFGR